MRTKGRRLGAGMVPGFDLFDTEDLFDDQGEVKPASKADLFRSSAPGYAFDAHGRRWKVVNASLGPGKRTIIGDPRQVVRNAKGALTEESVLFAELDGDEIIVSNINKRGNELRPVGKPLWRDRLGALPKSGIGPASEMKPGLIMFAGWRDITPKMRSRVRGVLRDWQWHKKPFEDTPYWSKRFAPYEEVFAHTRPPHPVTLYRSERTDIDNRYGDRFTSWSRIPSAVENFGWGSRRMVEATFRPEDILVDFLNVDLDTEGMQEVIVRPGKYDVKPWDKWAMFRRPSQPKLGAFTSNAELDRFKYRITKKQDGHVLRVYDGKTLIGTVGAITKYCDLPGHESHGNVVTAEIMPEYRGQKLYQEMLLRLSDYLKKMGCKGLKSQGFQRSLMADRAWRKLNPRVVPDQYAPSMTRKDVLFLDGLKAVPTPRGRDLIRIDRPWGAEFEVYEGDGKPIAFAATHFDDVEIDGRTVPVLQFDWLKVDPDWQKKKVSTWMTERIAWWAVSKGRALQSDWKRSKEREPFWEKQVRKNRVASVLSDAKGQTSYLLPLPAPDSLDGLPKSGRIPLDTAKRVMKRLPAKTRACGFTPAALREGMEIEREHRDVTGGAVLKTAKIAAAHLCERPDYYKRLKRYVER